MGKREAASPSGVGELLDRVLRRIDSDQRLHAYRVWSFWAEEVGETIASRAHPAGIHGGVLSIRVTSHSWIQELQFMKEDIRARLNKRLGKDLIRDIYFVSAPAPTVIVAKPEAPQATELEIPPLPAVRDPRIAAVFERIVRAHARRHGGS